ncbi:MAG TPA: sugar phosphate isomerase/epimerase family protein [Spirochaetia bacterium]|nr:sugar phosphate isomerase/epimerase family protein [Spirochaetia bacterium]
MHTIGVSPAYFISRYGEDFSPKNVAEGLGLLKELGYDAFQLEVFDPNTLDEWVEEGAQIVRGEARRLGLVATQFVAHFMLHGFVSADTVKGSNEIESARKIIRIVERFDECRLVTLPMGPYRPELTGTFRHADQWEKMRHRLSAVASIFAGADLRMAIELIPGAFFAGTDGLAQIINELGPETVGYNFDTGHANACKENVAIVPYRFGRKILGTHLCDNLGNENLSLRPGEGNIDWDAVFGALAATGYEGSLDVEIRCDPEDVTDKYDRALRAIRELRTRYFGASLAARAGSSRE